MCSQDEQFYINGNLPDFHQVDIPDIWIGLSGTPRTTETITKRSFHNTRDLPFIWFALWRFQIRTRTGISNGWINLQLRFPTMVLVGPETLQTPGTVDRSSQVESTLWTDTFVPFQSRLAIRWVYTLFQEIMMANGKQQTASRGWDIFVRWPVDRTPNQLQLQVSQSDFSFPLYMFHIHE